MTQTSADDEDLPSVSIVTLTHNRKKFFRTSSFLILIKLTIPKVNLNGLYMIPVTPRNNVEDMLPEKTTREKYNIRYTKSDAGETTGESRNAAMKQCQNDIIVFFDDDTILQPVFANELHHYV